MPVIWLQPLPQQSAVVYSQKTKYAQRNKLAVDQATATLQNIVKEQLSRLGESYREAQSFIKDQIDAVKKLTGSLKG